MNQLVVIICQNISPQLRRVLSLFLIEVAPLTFCGILSSKVRNELWKQMDSQYAEYDLTMVVGKPSSEQGFEYKVNNHAVDENVQHVDGLLLSVRRKPQMEAWETILGKTQPDYPLIRHLIDTSAVAEVLWNEHLSVSQRALISQGLYVDGKVASSQDALMFVKTAAGLHDIGKATPAWQVNTLRTQSGDSSLSGLTVPHEVDHSAGRWKHDINGGMFFESEVTCLTSLPLRDALSSIVAGHHGNYDTGKVFERVHRGETFPKEWVAVQQKIERQILQTINVSQSMLDSITEVKEETVILTTAIVILADWIASRVEFFSTMNESNSDYPQLFIEAKQLASIFVQQNGLAAPKWNEVQNISWEDVFPHIPTPNVFQKSVVENIEAITSTPGLTLINAPMGIGKTETALFIAAQTGVRLQNNGFWVTLPTQATANALFQRAVDIADKVYINPKNSVSLMHGNAAIVEAIKDIPILPGVPALHQSTPTGVVFDADTDDIISSGTPSETFISAYLMEKKLGGMSSISVSTMDQLINAALPLKHNVLRWLAAAGKTLILDEIHDFDAYTFELILKTLEWCGKFGIPVVAMSATLSGQRQRELAQAYLQNAGYRKIESQAVAEETIPEKGLESPEWVHFSPENKTVQQHHVYMGQEKLEYVTQLHITDDFLNTVHQLAGHHLEKDANILIVCHTVNQAVGTYRHLAQVLQNDVNLIHSRMSETQKQRVISDMLDRAGKTGQNRAPQVTVATQIVQQSMDIDYDVLITLACPLPELLQRIGRIHRHQLGEKRAEAYRDNPFIHVLVHPHIQNYAESPTVEPKVFVPYAGIDIISSLSVLQQQLHGKLINNWAAKSSIAEMFEEHNLFMKTTAYNEPYLALLQEKQNADFVKRTALQQVSINSPSAYYETVDSLQLTAPYTSRSSLAATTRLIDPNEDLVFVAPNTTGSFLILTDWNQVSQGEPAQQPRTRNSMLKLLGQNLVSVSTSFYKKYSLDAYQVDIPELNMYADTIKFINLPALLTENQLVADTVFEGLAPVTLEDNRYLWL